MRDAVWRHVDGRGAVCLVLDDFENEPQAEQLGVNPFVLNPGEPMSMYHWEADQEDLLVVSGEAVLIIEGEERPLRAWDFVHCPPKTKHVIVGAGAGPCLVIAVGAREHSAEPGSLGFPADEVAKRYGASVEEDTMDGGVAYGIGPESRADRVSRRLASRVALAPANAAMRIDRITAHTGAKRPFPQSSASAVASGSDPKTRPYRTGPRLACCGSARRADGACRGSCRSSFAGRGRRCRRGRAHPLEQRRRPHGSLRRSVLRTGRA